MCQDRGKGSRQPGKSSLGSPALPGLVLVSSQNIFLEEEETEAWEVKLCVLGMWLPNFSDHVLW